MIARRGVLKAGAVGLGTLMLPSGLAAMAQAGLVLVDPAVPRAERWLARLQVAAAQRVPIERDLVRQWRSGLRDRVAGAKPVLALVAWDKALILHGLAREERLRVQQWRTGRGAFVVALG